MGNATSQTAILLRKLYEWWTDPHTELRASDILVAGVTYDAGSGEDRVWWVEQKPPWTDLCVIDEVVGDTKGALVFEGVDSTTLLRHRVSWLVEVQGDRIARIVETVSMIG